MKCRGERVQLVWARAAGRGGGGRASIFTQKISKKRYGKAHCLAMGKKAKKQRQDSKKKAKKHNQQKNAPAPDSITAIFKVKRPDSHGPSCSASHFAAQPVIQLQKKTAAPETRPQTPPLRRRCCSPPVFVRTLFPCAVFNFDLLHRQNAPSHSRCSPRLAASLAPSALACLPKFDLEVPLSAGKASDEGGEWTVVGGGVKRDGAGAVVGGRPHKKKAKRAMELAAFASTDMCATLPSHSDFL
jgi:hypothetical protein